MLNIGGIKHDFGNYSINQNNYIHPSPPKRPFKEYGSLDYGGNCKNIFIWPNWMD